MLIERKNESACVDFDDVPIGEVFEQEGFLYFRIPTILEKGSVQANSITLPEFETAFFNGDEKVVIKKSRLIVEN